jgi:hypothetical protein
VWGGGGYSQRLLFNNVGMSGRGLTYPVTVKKHGREPQRVTTGWVRPEKHSSTA